MQSHLSLLLICGISIWTNSWVQGRSKEERVFLLAWLLKKAALTVFFRSLFKLLCRLINAILITKIILPNWTEHFSVWQWTNARTHVIPPIFNNFEMDFCDKVCYDTCQAVRQEVHMRWPHGSILMSLSFSAQILQSWKVEPISQYSSYCSCSCRKYCC